MKTETHEQCTVCFEVLDATDPTTITADILDQLQLLITKLNIKLIRNSPICDACLAKVKSACKFKTSYLDLQETFHDIKLEEDAYSEKPAVCEICKSIVSPSDTIPLFDPVTKINKLMLINHLSPELESKVNEDPQTCESCHKSMLNFCSITNLLSVFDQDIGDDSEMPSTTVKKEHLDIDSSLVSASSSKDISTIVKKEESPSEDEETEDKDCTEYEEFLTKNEELDLKMDCDEEQGDERKRIQSEQEPGNHSRIFQCEMCEFKSKYKHHLKAHMLIHKKADELEMFQCEICDFNTKYKDYIKRHMLKHKDPYETEMFHCEICEFKTKYKQYLKGHMLIHRKPDEIEMFQCDKCEFKTIYKKNLTRHVLIHIHKKPDEIKMFRCKMCDLQSRHKRCIQRHMRNKHIPDAVDLFQCEICEYKTSRKSNLKKHMLIHKKPDEIEMFHCQMCEFKSRHEGCVKRHMLTHKKSIEVEVFQCEMCEYKAKQKSNLKRHMVIHEKPNKKNAIMSNL